MVGQLLALIVASFAFEGELVAGSPFIEASVRVQTPWPSLRAGIEASIAGDFAAARGLVVARLALTEGLDLRVGVGRALAFRGVDTWEAELGLDLDLALDDRTGARLGLVALGYSGDHASQRGLIGLGRVGARVALHSALDLTIDLGWMGSVRMNRPFLAAGVAW